MASVAAISIAPAAWADDTGKDKKDPIVLEPISIDAKADVITGGVQLDNETIERINPVDVKDLFRQEPGVTVSSPIPMAQKVYVNGIEDTKLTVDVDGARQVTKTFHHIGTAVIDPGLLKAVKVETGVAPADAGPEALAGTISYETKDGRDIVQPGNTFGGWGKLSFNTNTEGFTETVALAARHEMVDALLYGTHANGNSYTDGDGNTVDGTAPELESALVKFGITGNSGYRLKVTANYLQDAGVRPVRPNFGGSSIPTNVPQFVDYEKKSATISFGDETPGDWFNPKLSVSYTNATLDAEIKNTPIGEGIVADITSINGKASNTFTFGLGTVTAGVDFYIDEGTGGKKSDANYTEQVSDVGAFAQARLSLTDSARVSFGGRIDRNRLEGNEGTVLTNTGLSGNVNGEYDITSWLMAYAGAGTAWGGIPMTEIGIQNYWSTFGITWNYDNLTPSRSFNYKVGAVVEFDDFTFDGNVYWTKIDDSHDVSSSNRADSHDVVSKGVNASAQYNWTNGFVRGTYTLSHVRVNGTVPTSTVAYQGILIGDMFSAEVGQAWPDWGLRAGATGEAALENDDPQENGFEPLPSYVVANLYGEWQPPQVPGLSVRVDVKNIFDRAYADRANVGYDSSRYIAYNDPGRSFVITAKYAF